MGERLMRLLNRVASRYHREQERCSWIERARSSEWLDQLIYVGYRSRGFAVRKVAHLVRDIAELAALAMVASLEFSTLALGLWIFGFVSRSLNESLFLSTRGLYASSERLAPRRAVLLGAALNFLVCSAALLWVFSRGSDNPTLVGLAALRLLGLAVENIMSFRALDYSTRKRVYVHPGLSLGLTAGGCLIFASFASSGLGWGAVVGISVVGIVLRLMESFAFLRATLRAEKLELTGSSPETSSASWRWRRVVYWLLPFGALAFLTALSGQVAFWAFLVQAVVQRPFLAMAVDVVRAVERRQWGRAETIVRHAQGLGRGFLFVFGTLGLVAAAIQPWVLLYGWMWVSVLRFGLLGQELRRFPSLAGWVLGLCVTQAVMLSFGAPASLQIVVALALGALFFVFFEQNQKADQLSLALEERFVESARSDELGINNTAFLWARNVGAEVLNKRTLSHMLVAVGLIRSIESPKRMREFLQRMRSNVRGTDLVVAWNSSQLIAWLPTAKATDLSVLRDRFMHEFPNHVSSVEVVTPKLLGVSDCPELESWSSVQCWLMWRVSKLTSDARFEFWFADLKGGWIDVSGQRPHEGRRDELDELSAKASAEVFMNSMKTHWSSAGPQPAWTVKAAGVVSCVCIGSLGSVRPAILEQLQRELSIGLLVQDTIRPPELRPLVVHWMRKLLEGVAWRVQAKLIEASSPPQPMSHQAFEFQTSQGETRKLWWSSTTGVNKNAA
jgi:hypothetical protein